MDFDFSAYLMPTITAICFILAEVFKRIVRNDRAQDFIPLGCCAVGVVLAIWVAAGSGDPISIDVVLTGMVSGLAATGVYEAIAAPSGSPVGKHASSD